MEENTRNLAELSAADSPSHKLSTFHYHAVRNPSSHPPSSTTTFRKQQLVIVTDPSAERFLSIPIVVLELVEYGARSWLKPNS